MVDGSSTIMRLTLTGAALAAGSMCLDIATGALWPLAHVAGVLGALMVLSSLVVGVWHMVEMLFVNDDHAVEPHVDKDAAPPEAAKHSD